MSNHRPPPAYSGDLDPFDRRDHTPRLWDQPSEGGTFRRRIVVRAVDEHAATGELEDDFHHFRVDLRHDGSTVVAIDGSGIRGPWTTCMDAGEPLRAIEGRALSTHPTVLAGIDARSNCTHLFDLAGLVITHAARTGGRRADRRNENRGRRADRRNENRCRRADRRNENRGRRADRRDDNSGRRADRRYDISLSGAADTRSATLWRDGSMVLDWELRDGEISAPAAWVGAPLRTKFIPWACDRFAGDDDAAEAAIALRRAIDISRGRQMDLDGMATAEPLLPMMDGICYSMTGANAPVAIRSKGSARDFSDHPELLLGDFDNRRA